VKALVLKSVENLEVMDVPMPELRPGFVIVKVSRCGVCGSDIRYFHGENPWAKQTLQREIPTS
jgi:L-iditol 2-dehydrogenase